MKKSQRFFGLENAPTCYRAPKWPDPEFPRKIPKKYPRPEILDSQNLAPKYPENTKKYPRNTKKCAFWLFFGIFGVFLGAPEFRPGGLFSVFFVEIPGRAISGLCSRSGRSQLWAPEVPFPPREPCDLFLQRQVARDCERFLLLSGSWVQLVGHWWCNAECTKIAILCGCGGDFYRSPTKSRDFCGPKMRDCLAIKQR